MSPLFKENKVLPDIILPCLLLGHWQEPTPHPRHPTVITLTFYCPRAPLSLLHAYLALWIVQAKILKLGFSESDWPVFDQVPIPDQIPWLRG